MKTVIIGLGNPILTDDGAGVRVARAVCEMLAKNRMERDHGGTLDVMEIYAGGIRLLDAMTGYDRAYIVDAMKTGRFEPGAIRDFTAGDFCTTRNILCTHDTDLSTALELGRMLGLHLPSDIRIWGIEAGDVTTFGETLTSGVESSVEAAAKAILSELRMGVRRGTA